MSAALVLLLAAVVSGLCRLRGQRPTHVEVDAKGVRSTYGGEDRNVRWDELVEVGIVTTGDGPFGDDLFWVLIDGNGKCCCVPGERVDGTFLSRLQRLPGFDNVAVIRAMGSIEDASFKAWRGAVGEGAACASEGQHVLQRTQ